MIGVYVQMCDKEQIVINSDKISHNIIKESINVNFSVEPSTEKDYDIFTMTGHNNEENNSEKGSDEK